MKQLRRRYPTGLGTVMRIAAERDTGPEFTWPDWCLVPVGASVAATQPMRDPADVARMAAAATWRLTKGVYVLTDEAFASAQHGVTAADGRVTHIDAESWYRLPEDCCYIATEAGFGLYVHLEHDVNTRRPELRLLFDSAATGTLDDLLPFPIFLDRKEITSPTFTVTDAFQAVKNLEEAQLQALGVTPLESRRRGATDPARDLVGRLLLYSACLVDDSVTLQDPNAPADRPARVERHSRLKGAPQARFWRVGFPITPTLRAVQP